MFESGHLTVLRFRQVPLRLHWTLPVGMMVFGGLRFAPAFWAGFFLLVLVHELGHAGLVRLFGHRVLSVDVTGFGGLCRWAGHATPMERGAIAWGGVLAQSVLLAGTLLFVLLAGAPRTLWAMELVSVFTWTNLWIIGLNLLPIPPLDGADAWRFVAALGRGTPWPRRAKAGPRSRAQTDARPSEPPKERVDSVVWKPSRFDPRFNPRLTRVWARFRDRGSRKPPPQEQPSGGTAAPSPSKAELADVLRRIGDEAARARRGQS